MKLLELIGSASKSFIETSWKCLSSRIEMNYWKDKSFPKTGWESDFVDDLSLSRLVEDYEDCQMCGRENIRFVHHINHPSWPETLEVGRICAGNLTGDTTGTMEREVAAKNKAKRRKTWMVQDWKRSHNGNPRRKLKDIYVTLFLRDEKWHYALGKEFSRFSYRSQEQAKLAAFDRYEELIEAWKQNPFNVKKYETKVHADWGAFFAKLGWDAEYKPATTRTICRPTFLVKSKRRNCLVFVEQNQVIDKKFLNRAAQALMSEAVEYTLLIVGKQPFTVTDYDNHPMIGWTDEWNEFYELDEIAEPWLAYAPFISDKNGKFDFCHSEGCYHGRLTDYYEGGEWPLNGSEHPFLVWNKAQAELRKNMSGR